MLVMGPHFQDQRVLSCSFRSVPRTVWGKPTVFHVPVLFMGCPRGILLAREYVTVRLPGRGDGMSAPTSLIILPHTK
jgi:hypothetical protein